MISFLSFDSLSLSLSRRRNEQIFYSIHSFTSTREKRKENVSNELITYFIECATRCMMLFHSRCCRQHARENIVLPVSG